MCCRRRQYNHQTQYLTTPPFHQPGRRGCCNSKRQRRLPANPIDAYTSNVYYPQSPPPLPQQDVYYSQPRGCRRKKQCHGPFTMAALLLGAIGLGAEKLKEKRDERKQKKAMLQWEEEQSYEAARKSALKNAKEIKRQERGKSEEAAEERRASASEGSRRGETLESECVLEGPPPPTYEQVIKETV